MSYGISYQDVSRVHTPAAIQESWGTRTVCTARPEYGFERLVVRAGAVVRSHYFVDSRCAYYVETGTVVALVREADGTASFSRLAKGGVLRVGSGVVHAFRGGDADTEMYCFSSRNQGERRYAESPGEAERSWSAAASVPPVEATGRTQDFRDKYWGSIETIVDDDFAGKRIFLRRGGQSSLEFHTHKVESYYLHAGSVRVGLRTGRAENRSIVLSAGQSFDVIPGLMHMRIGVTDALIIEASTRDTDSDSHLVEDGTKYTHVDIQE